jgi:hypothetical protein
MYVDDGTVCAHSRPALCGERRACWSRPPLIDVPQAGGGARARARAAEVSRFGDDSMCAILPGQRNPGHLTRNTHLRCDVIRRF